MTSPAETAAVLARARAARPAAARAAAVSPSAPPPDAHEEPKAGSPEDIGHVQAPRPARRGALPPSDREVLGAALEEVRHDAAGFWVVLVRPCGRRSWHRGNTEAAALARARAWWERRAKP